VVRAEERYRLNIPIRGLPFIGQKLLMLWVHSFCLVLLYIVSSVATTTDVRMIAHPIISLVISRISIGVRGCRLLRSSLCPRRISQFALGVRQRSLLAYLDRSRGTRYHHQDSLSC